MRLIESVQQLEKQVYSQQPQAIPEEEELEVDEFREQTCLAEPVAVADPVEPKKSMKRKSKKRAEGNSESDDLVSDSDYEEEDKVDELP